jgi:hypothetical protein
MAFTQDPEDGIYQPPVDEQPSMPIMETEKTGDRWITRKVGTQTGMQDTPPSLDDASKAAKLNFESWVQDEAGRKQANDFWKGIGDTVGGGIQSVINQPQFAPARWAVGKIGEGIDASHEVTEGGLGTIQAQQLLQKHQTLQRLKDNNAHVGYQRSEGSTRVTDLGAPGPAKGVEVMTDDELNRLNSFLHNVGGISDDTKLPADDWRVIMNAAKRMRDENPSLVDSATSMALDPMNLPLSVVGGGPAVRAAAGKIDEISEAVGKARVGHEAQQVSPAFAARTGATKSGAPGEKSTLIGTNEYPPATIGVKESLPNLFYQYEARGPGEFTIQSGKETIIIRVDPNMPAGVGGETNVTRGGQRFIRIPPGLSEDAFNKLMTHELEHAGQLGPSGQNLDAMARNRVGMERRAYAATGDSPNVFADAESKAQAGWPAENMPISLRQGGSERSALDMLKVLEESIFGTSKRGSYKMADDELSKILEGLKKSTNPGQRRIGELVEKMKAEGKSDEDIFKALGGDLNAPEPTGPVKPASVSADDAKTAVVAQNMQKAGHRPEVRGKDVYSPGGKLIKRTNSTEEAEAFAAGINRRIDELSTTPETPKAGKGFKVDPAKEAQLKGRIPKLTPEQIREAKAPIVEKIMAEHGIPVERGAGKGIIDEIAEAEAIEARTTHYDQTAIFDPSEFDDPARAGSFTRPGDNFPEPLKEIPPGPRTEVHNVKPEGFQGGGTAPGDVPTNTPDWMYPKGGKRNTAMQDNPKTGGDPITGTRPDGPAQKFEQVYAPWTKEGASKETGVGDVYQALLDSGIAPPGKGGMFGGGSAGGFGGFINAVVGTPRQLKAMGDLSALLNQGGIAAIAHNNEWRQFAVDSAKALATEEGYKAVKAATKANKNYEFGRRMGLANAFEGDVPPLAGDAVKDLINAPRRAGYEAFDIGVAREIPVLGKIAERSDKAYEAGLASLRTNIFDTLATSWNLQKRIAQGGAEGAKAERTAKALADFVNSISGYGHLGLLEKPQVAEVLNKMFFAPRFFSSRINNIFAPFVYTGKAAMGQTDWKLAAYAWRDIGGYAASTFTILKLAEAAGAEVEWDTRSSRFGTIKIGDHYIDTTGGMARTFAALHASFATFTGGEVVTGGGREARTIDPEFGDKNGYQIMMDWMRTKLNVPLSTAIDVTMAGNRNVVNEPLGVTGHIPLPIGLNNLGEAIIHDVQNSDLGLHSLTGLLNLVGIGVNTYELGEEAPSLREGPFGIDRALGDAVGITEPPSRRGGRRALP